MNIMNTKATEVTALKTVMRLESVTKRYGPVVALNDVTIDLHAGVVHAIVGENGAGKSTLINVASGVVIPTSGEILFEGEPVIDA
jgi:ribose transport system ATP-binding protein